MRQVPDPKSDDALPLALATDAWLAVVQTYNECTATLSQRLAPLGLSLLEHEVLMNLLRSDDLTQKQLSQRCFSAKSGISMLVSRFEESGLIDRRQSKVDQRALLLSLTPKGHAIAQQAFGVQTEVIAAMVKTSSDGDLALVKSLMDNATASLRALRDG